MAVQRGNTFKNLESAQAAELLLLLDLEAEWQNLLQTPSLPPEAKARLQNLHGKQKAYAAFHDHLIAYNERYKPVYVPEGDLNSEARLGVWCRAIRDLCLSMARGSQSHYAIHLLKKAYRCADRIAVRMHRGVIPQPTQGNTIGAITLELEELIRWCESATGVPSAA